MEFWQCKGGKENNDDREQALAAYILRQWQLDCSVRAIEFGGQGCQHSHLKILMFYNVLREPTLAPGYSIVKANQRSHLQLK